MTEFEHITSESVIAVYDASSGVFAGILSEMRELSKKKPDVTLNNKKVEIINRVLGDLLSFLKEEPEGKYLDLLDDEELPQNSDAVLVMVQYEKAITAFSGRYHGRILGEYDWITEERLSKLREMRGE